MWGSEKNLYYGEDHEDRKQSDDQTKDDNDGHPQEHETVPCIECNRMIVEAPQFDH
jgi:hypothetical protein